jgi:hypothetical protein
VVTVSATDGIRVLGSRSEVTQSFELYGSVHAARPVFFFSSSSPDQGHRIVRFARSVVADKQSYVNLEYDAGRALPVST